MILKGVLKDKLPLETIEKLKKLSMLGVYDLLQRNLGVLISKDRKNTESMMMGQI